MQQDIKESNQTMIKEEEHASESVKDIKLNPQSFLSVQENYINKFGKPSITIHYG